MIYAGDKRGDPAYTLQVDTGTEADLQHAVIWLQVEQREDPRAPVARLACHGVPDDRSQPALGMRELAAPVAERDGCYLRSLLVAHIAFPSSCVDPRASRNCSASSASRTRRKVAAASRNAPSLTV